MPSRLILFFAVLIPLAVPSTTAEAQTRPQSAIGLSAAETRELNHKMARLAAEKAPIGVSKKDMQAYVQTYVDRRQKEQPQITMAQLEAAAEQYIAKYAVAVDQLNAALVNQEGTNAEIQDRLSNIEKARESARAGDFEAFAQLMANYRKAEQKEAINAQWKVIEAQIEPVLINSAGASETLRLQGIDTWIQFLKEYIAAAPLDMRAAPQAWGEKLEAAKRELLKTTPWLAGSVPDIITDSAGDVFQIRFFPDGRRIASAARDGSVSLWNVAGRSRLARIEYPGDKVAAFAISPDGRRIAIGTYNGAVAILNAATGIVEKTLDRHYAQVLAIAWSADGRAIASTSKDDSIRLQDVQTGQTSRMLADLRDCFLPRPSDAPLAGGLHRGSSNSLDAACRIPYGTEAVDIAFTNDGRSVIYNEGVTGIVQNISTGKIEARLGGDGIGKTLRTTAPNSGSVYVTEGRWSGFRLWRPKVNRLICSSEHDDDFKDIAVSRDGKFLGVATAGNTVRVYGLDCGMLAELEGHGMPVSSLDFAPDSRSVVSGGEDGKIIIWRDRSERGLNTSS